MSDRKAKDNRSCYVEMVTGQRGKWFLRDGKFIKIRGVACWTAPQAPPAGCQDGSV